MSQIEDSILRAVKIMIEGCLSKAPFDRTIRGRIVSQADSRNYNVEFQGQVHKVPAYGSTTFTENEIVWVCIPENNFNNRFLLPK